jgi:diguanylate cyclase (GGDEF)-like protein
MKKKKPILLMALSFIVFYTSIYYIWVTYWKNSAGNETTSTDSPDLFIFGLCTAILLLVTCLILIMLENRTLKNELTRKTEVFEKKKERIKYLAFHDSLTGLANRALFEQVLKEAVTEHKLVNEMAVMFIDLDRFKIINDTLGHDIGDRLLQMTAKRLESCACTDNTVARIGGDEFTILLKGIGNREAAEVMARKILDSLNQPFYINEHEIISTPSIGVALYSSADDTPHTLMKKADLAMYHVKENGKGYYKIFDETNKEIFQKLMLEKDICKALSKKEFFLVYQPQMDAKKGKMVGVEALLRWNHSTFGLVSPAEFIPIAEETGMIIPIGDWVLREACLQAKRWEEQGHLLKIGVNLSPRQLQQEDVVERIAAILKVTKVNPHYIDLEITEATAMINIHNVIPKLMALKELGVKISIDDFGTGYSSLSYLANFPIDTLKIAREFISKVGIDEFSLTIISTIIDLAQKLNLNVVAEGVERENQAALLQEVNCHEIQGYLYGKPDSVQAIEKILFKGKHQLVLN